MRRCLVLKKTVKPKPPFYGVAFFLSFCSSVILKGVSVLKCSKIRDSDATNNFFWLLF